MLKPLKAVAIGIGIVLILIALVGLVLATPENGLMRPLVEYKLSQVYGVDVEAASVRMRPLRGVLEISGLTIANPPEFEKDRAAHFGTIQVFPEMRSLFSKNPAIERIEVEELTLFVRYGLGKGTNIGALAKHASEMAENNQGHIGGNRTFTVREMQVAESKLKLNTPPLTLTVPAFRVEDFNEGDSLSTAKLASLTLKTVVLETVTIKGLLRPLANLLKEEFPI